MKIDLKAGLITPAILRLSPNQDPRVDPNDIDLLVIHGISLPPGEFGSEDIPDFFSNQLKVNRHPYFEEIAHLKVSSHLFIRREGTIWQFVPFSQRAWHAGQSVFQGRAQCNDYSIGIELEGTDDQQYTMLQYDQLARVSHCLMASYPKITLDRIVGHSDIAPGRKTDPGSCFDWPYFRRLLLDLSSNKLSSQKADIER